MSLDDRTGRSGLGKRLSRSLVPETKCCQAVAVLVRKEAHCAIAWMIKTGGRWPLRDGSLGCRLGTHPLGAERYLRDSKLGYHHVVLVLIALQ